MASLGNSEVPVGVGIAGVMIGKSNLPLVSEGMALYHIVRFRKSDVAAELVAQFQYETGSDLDR